METGNGATPSIYINHDVATGDVNLLQVAGYVRGGNARRHATASMKALGMAERVDKKIRGIGKEVLVGTYEEALQIAVHLGADDNKLNAIKAALTAVAQRDSKGPVVYTTFPIVFDGTWSKMLGYKHHHDGTRKIENLINRDILSMNTHVQSEEYVNLNNGQTLQRYRFSVNGFKIFASLCGTNVATQISSELATSIDTDLFFKSMLKKRDRIELRATEAEVRDRLAAKLHGATEVRCSHGRVDILTETYVIEVKKACLYKAAIGQVLVYRNMCFPLKKCKVHLFATDLEMKTIRRAQRACNGLDIDLTYEIVQFTSQLFH